jgi:lipoic acid synthetase
MTRVSLSNQVLDNHVDADDFVRKGKPKWLRAQLPSSPRYAELVKLVKDQGLHTVCQEASCPNMGECWSAGVATLMILGDTCTRSCGFCHIKTGRPPVLDTDEPRRVADVVAAMDLEYVVITSVNRDELPDGGAAMWAETIQRTREQCPNTQIEVLIPDFCGDWDALQQVIDARPDVLNHNLETVPRMYRAVRPQAKYDRSVELLKRTREAGLITKTGIMVGIGETDDEVLDLMRDVIERTRVNRDQETKRPRDDLVSPGLANHESKITDHRSAACDILTIGQYLQPSPAHLPVHRFVEPATFDLFKREGEQMGFTHVESGPMVRSSYHADRQAVAARNK